MIDLRLYQGASLDAILAYWSEGGGNPLVDLATGTGKSVVLAELVRQICEMWPDMRVLCLVHVKELVEQNVKALLRLWPGAPVGINAAGLGRRDRHHQILFASIQSVYGEDGYSLGKRDLVLIDEAHLVPKSGDGMYRTLLDKLRERTPDLRVAGFTATPYRLGEGRLDRGDDRLFDKIVYTYGIGDAVADGWLAPLVSKATMTGMDVSGAPEPVRTGILNRLNTPEAPTPKVIDHELWQAQQQAKREAAEAKVTPEERKKQQKRDQARRAADKRHQETWERERAENDAKREVRGRRAAELIRQYMPADAITELYGLLKISTGMEIVDALSVGPGASWDRGPYGERPTTPFLVEHETKPAADTRQTATRSGQAASRSEPTAEPLPIMDWIKDGKG